GPFPGGAADAADPSRQPRVIDAYREGQDRVTVDGRLLSEQETSARCPATARDPKSECVDRSTVRLNDIVYVKADNLSPLLDRAKCLDGSKVGRPPLPNCQPQDILLFLNGRPIKGLSPESGAPSIDATGRGTLRYHLRRYVGTSETAKTESDEHWADLLGLDPGSSQMHLVRDGVTLSVGLENEYPIATDVTNFHLRRMRGYFLAGFLTLGALLLYVLVRLAKESDVLRDRKPVMWGQRPPYSLSASQAAFWFVLTILSFVFIWLVTGEYDLSTSVLVLLGIGFGTALGATVIDKNKGAAPASGTAAGNAELDSLLARKAAEEATMKGLEAQLRAGQGNAELTLALTQALANAKTAYAATVAEITRAFPAAIGSGTNRFYLDVLSDENGISFHRFQMAVWTVVLGGVFVYSVISRLAMPRFSDTLLMLMGISAGTYLGFKVPEKTPPAAPPAG
ncbi:MAG: hypothetical protein ABI652_01180, partial [Acidobacteriota bacterium]